MSNRNIVPDAIPEHHSALRQMIAEVNGFAYEPLKSLQDAKAVLDAFMIMEGDDGGQIYLVCPIHLVRCEEATLHELLAELDTIAWACNKGDGAGLYFEKHKTGETIGGGMGGGKATNDLWIHPEFIAAGLEERIRRTISGAIPAQNGT